MKPQQLRLAATDRAFRPRCKLSLWGYESPVEGAAELRGGRSSHPARRPHHDPHRGPTGSRRTRPDPGLLAVPELPADPHRHPISPLRQPHRRRRPGSRIRARAVNAVDIGTAVHARRAGLRRTGPADARPMRRTRSPSACRTRNTLRRSHWPRPPWPPNFAAPTTTGPARGLRGRAKSDTLNRPHLPR